MAITLFASLSTGIVISLPSMSLSTESLAVSLSYDFLS